MSKSSSTVKCQFVYLRRFFVVFRPPPPQTCSVLRPVRVGDKKKQFNYCQRLICLRETGQDLKPGVSIDKLHHLKDFDGKKCALRLKCSSARSFNFLRICSFSVSTIRGGKVEIGNRMGVNFRSQMGVQFRSKCGGNILWTLNSRPADLWEAAAWAWKSWLICVTINQKVKFCLTCSGVNSWF